MDVKQWLLRGPPSVGVARPAHCRACGAASRPLGRALVLHGHGLRARTIIVRSGEQSTLTEILARRYVCGACDAVALVVSADVARRCLYVLRLIAMALAAWSHGGRSAREVRAELGAYAILGAGSTGWPSLVRWARAATRLWRRIAPIADGSPRARAEQLAAELGPLDIPAEPLDTSATAEQQTTG